MLLSNRLLLYHNLALEGGPNFRWQYIEEYLQVLKNNQEHQSKVISLGLEIPIEQVDETITHPLVRTRLANAIKGGAVPRLSTDEPTDIDIFPKQVEGHASGEATQTD